MKVKNFIILIVAIIIVVIGLGILMNRDTSGPSKYDDFAKALKEKGAEFYGAFWCSHCQDQKAEFGSSKKYLPYIECSNPNNSTVQVCTDEKIEGYPTWIFRNGITINSEVEPLICDIRTESIVESELCQNRSSQYRKTWIFPNYDFPINSSTDPIREGNIWKFPGDAHASGKISLPLLAEQIQFTLPQ